MQNLMKAWKYQGRGVCQAAFLGMRERDGKAHSEDMPAVQFGFRSAFVETLNPRFTLYFLPQENYEVYS